MRRFRCLTCQRTFTALHHEGRLTQARKRSITKDHLRGKPMRELVRVYHHSSVTITSVVHEITAHIPSSHWINQRFKPQWSGILGMDGKYIRVYDFAAEPELPRGAKHKQVWLAGVDIPTGDLPHDAVAEEETMIDLVMYFQMLKQCHYPLKVLVSDGNDDIVRAATKVYGRTFVVQLCNRHFIQNLRGIQQPEDVDGERTSTNQLVDFIEGALAARDETTTHQMVQAIWKARTWFPTPTQQTILARVRQHWWNLTAHFRYPHLSIPRNNNHIENLFHQLDNRLERFGLFHDWQSAQNWLHAWATLRRFTAYTDCKGHNKYKNGKAPLQLTQVNTCGNDPLHLIR